MCSKMGKITPKTVIIVQFLDYVFFRIYYLHKKTSCKKPFHEIRAWISPIIWSKVSTSDGNSTPLPKILAFPNPMFPPLLCPKNVDFVISCKFRPLCLNCPPTTSRPYLGNPVVSKLELKKHCLNKVYAICLKFFKQLCDVKSFPKVVQPLFIFFKKFTPIVYFHNCL